MPFSSIHLLRPGIPLLGIQPKTIGHLSARGTASQNRAQFRYTSASDMAPYQPTKREASRIAKIVTQLEEVGRKRAALAELQAKPERPFFLWHLFFQDVFARGGFDIVIANPPYGRILSRAHEHVISEAFPAFSATCDAFIAFTLHAFNTLLRPGGILSYIVPSAWLGGPNYTDFRRELLRQTVNQIVVLPFDIFKEAYVDTLIFLAERSPVDPTHNLKAFTYPKRAKFTELSPEPWEVISQHQISRRRDVKFLLSQSAIRLSDVMEKGCKGSFNDIVEMKRGVLFDKKLLTDCRSGPNSYRYFEGDVYRYILNYRAPSWVEFGAKMTEYPDDFRWFEGERLLLRRLVNRQQRLMATFAKETFITNKNLYSILPKSNSPPLKAILAILNSTLISRLYIEAVSQATKDDFPQVTIIDTLALPFPTEFSPNQHTQLSTIAEWLLWLHAQPTVAESTPEHPRDPLIAAYFEHWVNALVYELYFPAEIHAAGLHFFDLTAQHILPRLPDSQEETEILFEIRERFERLYDLKHPLRAGLFSLGSLDLVRIIENRE